jgi:hypothetical protein
VDRKNITIRDEQTEWIRRSGLNLSEFVRDRLDEEMGPSDEELARAYEENAEHAKRVNEEWERVSTEANRSLGEPAGTDTENAE